MENGLFSFLHKTSSICFEGQWLIDPMHKWLPIKNSFVSIKISPSNLNAYKRIFNWQPFWQICFQYFVRNFNLQKQLKWKMKNRILGVASYPCKKLARLIKQPYSLKLLHNSFLFPSSLIISNKQGIFFSFPLRNVFGLFTDIALKQTEFS